MSTIAIPHVAPLLAHYPLAEDEHYALYLLRTDGWPYGYVGVFDDPQDVQEQIDTVYNRRSVIGIWITKESDDGTVDITIFKHETLRR